MLYNANPTEGKSLYLDAKGRFISRLAVDLPSYLRLMPRL
jgi:hypothetical protein